MKLIRFGLKDYEKPGVQNEEGIRIDVSGFGEDYTRKFFETNGINRLQKWLETHLEECPEVESNQRWGAPFCMPSKIICVGLNYAKHALEGGMDVPKEPVLFFKSTSSIIGPYDDVMLPKNSTKTDWEVELALVIGKKASYVDKTNALDYVSGYVIHNDISEREFQLERFGQWVKGKSCDTFAPFGPFLATSEEIKNPHGLDLWLKVNDDIVQKSNTSDFIFDIPYIVSYISQFMTLLPGDVISTGTPSGVGLGFIPPRYLKSGDVMTLGINGLGTSKQKVVPFSL